MKIFKFTVIVIILNGRLYANAQSSKSEIELITTTLMGYIEGTANGEPERLRKAFHSDFNLYI